MAKNIVGAPNKAYEVLKQMKGVGIVVSIIIILLGICLFIKPIATGTVMVWILVVGLLINGITKIVTYCKTPKEVRDGFLLAAGILLCIASLILIGRGLNCEYAVTASIEICISFMIAFTSIFTGIGRISESGAIKAAGGSKGLAIFAGILDILLGILLLSSPLFGLFAITIVFGLYLTVTGIALLIRFLSL